uniref:Uncharacterized protein n=1 Tax=Leersia perrieri TaxID=77586 RepID=A0A0D9V8S3_9ORYZ
MEGLIPFIYRAIKERRSRTYSRCSSDMSAARKFGGAEDDVVVWEQTKPWGMDGGGGEREMTAHRRHRSLEELAGEVGASPQWQQGGLARGRSARIFSCISGMNQDVVVVFLCWFCSWFGRIQDRVSMEAMSALAPPPPPPPAELMVPVVGYGGGGAGEAAAGTTAVRGSYGPVIAMLAVLAVLAAVAVAVGRLCFGGRRVLGHAGAGGHDLEAWVERTCGPCVGATIFSAAGGGGQAKEEGDGGGMVSATEDSAPPAEQPPPAATEEGNEQGDGIVSAGS